MRNQAKQQKRNELILKTFNEMADMKYNGKRKYSYDYIFEKLGERFFLQAETIEKIIKAQQRQ